MFHTALSYVRRTDRRLGISWRYRYNLSPTLAYAVNRHQCSGESARVVADLNRNGIAITSVHDLLGSNSCFNELRASVEKLERDEVCKIESARKSMSRDGNLGKKSFIFPLLGARPVFNPNDVYARFAMHGPIFEIANAYFRMYTQLRYYNVWHTFSSSNQDRESQLWHRDFEDRYILKVFLYLSEVDDASGPFVYAKGTHGKARPIRDPSHFVEAGVKRTTDTQMEDVVPSEQWISAVGPKGTIIFADTRGYHKGGSVRKGDRILYTCMFTSQASA